MTDHTQNATIIQERLTSLWTVYHAIREEADDLNMLCFAHVILADHPTAVKVHMSVTDQGGDTMVFNEVEMADGTTSEDDDDQTYWQYCADMTWDDLSTMPQIFQPSNRAGGYGALILSEVIETLEPIWRNFIAGKLPPMPDPTDKDALIAWLNERVESDNEETA